MTLSTETLAALIGAACTLCVFVVKDLLAVERHNRLTSQRELLQSRIEHAYAPVEFLLYHLLQVSSENHKEKYHEELRNVLCHYSYLLSENTTSALYVLLEDEDAGAALLQPHFFDEFAALKKDYYKLWYTKRSNKFHLTEVVQHRS